MYVFGHSHRIESIGEKPMFYIFTFKKNLQQNELCASSVLLTYSSIESLYQNNKKENDR